LNKALMDFEERSYCFIELTLKTGLAVAVVML
jgi:hypothetical protein